MFPSYRNQSVDLLKTEISSPQWQVKMEIVKYNYENYSLRETLFKTFKQHSDYKSVIAKTSDGNKLSMKSQSLI